MDWDLAYSNADAVANSAIYPERFAAAAADFRDAMGDRARLDVAYGDAERERYDLFLPEETPEGLAVFVHGGYWLRFSKNEFSFVAAGAVAHGWAVAIPSYTPCPGIAVAAITQQIVEALSHAADAVAGPVRLAGHSAGGHLAARMACTDVALSAEVAARIAHVLPISGVHDLRPILNTAMNEDIRLTHGEAVAESPCLLTPRQGTRLTAWVGADELPEFVRQSRLIANIWAGFAIKTRCVEDTRRHHYDVIEPLADPDSPIVRCWLKD